MNNRRRTNGLIACALLSLGFAAASPAMEPQPDAVPPSIDFRAAGYEPAWLFELEQRGGIRFVADGRTTVVPPVREFVGNVAHGGIIYGARTDTQELLAEIVQLSCADAVSGERLSHTVTIRLDGHEYHGCGRRVRNGEGAEFASSGDHGSALTKD